MGTLVGPSLANVRAGARSPMLSAAGALGRLFALPRAGLGRWPTPLELHSLSDGRPLWIKRDDLSGLGRGGAKARKIDLVVGHMLAHGHDELITLAGNVTNLAFDLLPVLARFGIRATLLIVDEPVVASAERRRIFHGIAGRVHLVGPSHVAGMARALSAFAEARAVGRRPLLLLPGASHPAGVFGNALGFLELLEQLRELRAPAPSAVFVTAATGTTLAGFLLAEHLQRLAGGPAVRVVGVEAYSRTTRARTLALLRWAERALGLDLPVPASRIAIDRGQLASGFGRHSQGQAALCDRVGERLGIAIDPLFGGKTWSALESATGLDASRPALYWHCGFTPEWRTVAAAVRGG